VLTRLDGRGRCACACNSDRADAFGQHQSADAAQEDNVARRHHELDLAGLLQQAKDIDPARGTRDAANEQHQTHFGVEPLASPLRQGAGKR